MRRIALTLILCLVFLYPVKILSAGDVEDVQALIYEWRDAWESKDFERYISFYSADFQTKSFNFQTFMDKKARLFQQPGTVTIELSDFEIRIEDQLAVARFVQRYQGAGTSDVGEKTLILINPNLKWKIISEEWEPLNRPAPTIKKEAAPSTSKKITVKSIKFQIGKDGTEKVFVALSHFVIPEIIALGGNNPRIAIDIMNVSIWDGDATIPVNGKFIRRIRTHLHPKAEKLRIVLDLAPDSDVLANPTYYRAENIYCLEVKNDTFNADP